MINPADLQHVYAGANPEGHALVDHVFHLNHGDQRIAADYKAGVLASPGVSRPIDMGSPAGKTARFVSLPSGTRFMVSPYHQTIPLHLSHVYHYPLGGWSEMTSHALYHAGGLGHLVEHQHVAEHETPGGDFEPLLVTHFHPNFVHMTDGRHEGHPRVMADAAKVGFMDFLTNNQSRHPYNMLLSRPTGPDVPSEHLMVTGHGDSFQYKRPNRWQKQHTKFDHLMYYLLDSPGMAALSHDKARVHGSDSVDDAVQWWKQQGSGVRNAFDLHVGTIENKAARAHVASNFHARANALDHFSHAWEGQKDMLAFSPYRWRERGQRERSSVAMVPVFVHKPEAK
jgi:hypothetical protein